MFVISIIISWTNKRERPSRFLFKFIVNIFMETIRDYLELQSLFHLYIYIYMYTDSIETFTTFTVNRVRINHQEIESLLRSLRFSNKRRRNMTIFPDSNKLFNKTIPNYSRKSRNRNTISKIGSSSPQHPQEQIYRFQDPRFQRGGSVSKWFFFSPRPPRVAENTLSSLPSPSLPRRNRESSAYKSVAERASTWKRRRRRRSRSHRI